MAMIWLGEEVEKSLAYSAWGECCYCSVRRLCGIMSAKVAEIFCALHLST